MHAGAGAGEQAGRAVLVPSCGAVRSPWVAVTGGAEGGDAGDGEYVGDGGDDAVLHDFDGDGELEADELCRGTAARRWAQAPQEETEAAAPWLRPAEPRPAFLQGTDE